MRNTNVLIAPDSFKNCLPAEQVAHHLAHGIQKHLSSKCIVLFPIADGGEGFCKNLTKVRKGKFRQVETQDPLMRKIQAVFGILSDETAVMDIASASGMELLTPTERNPLFTSTYGSGLVIKKMIETDHKKILIGLGGSATNDGGIGLAKALGFRFLAKNGKEIEPHGKGLGELDKIDDSSVIEQLRQCKISAACDVSNPLLGKNGASLVYSQQKGASQEDAELLEKNLSLLNQKVIETYGKQYQNLKGSGAAGGLGFALAVFLQAELHSGIELFMQESGLLKQIQKFDFIISGEGEINQQTNSGKALSGISKLAKEYKIPMIAVTGKSCIKNDFYRTYELETYALSKIESLKNAPRILERIGEEIGYLIENRK